MCSSATGLGRLWRCRRTISAIWSSPSNSKFPSALSCSRLRSGCKRRMSSRSFRIWLEPWIWALKKAPAKRQVAWNADQTRLFQFRPPGLLRGPAGFGENVTAIRCGLPSRFIKPSRRCLTRRSWAKGGPSIRASSPDSTRPSSNRTSSLGWRSTAWARGRSITNFEIGCLVASGIGESRFRSCTKWTRPESQRGSSYHYPPRNCRSLCRNWRITSPRAGRSHLWRKRNRGSG